MPRPVKPPRVYDASGRRAAADARRAEVLAAARELFLDGGFAGTTVAAIAERAGVSPETIYKGLGGKRGLIEALYGQALRGAGPVPAEERSDGLRSNPDPHEVVRGWARLSMEVAPLVTSIQLLVRDAALVDPRLRSLLADLDDRRMARMRENAVFLATAGHLRPGVSVDHAADLMWTVTAPEVVELLMHRRGWSREQYADFVHRTLAGALLRPSDPGGRVSPPADTWDGRSGSRG